MKGIYYLPLALVFANIVALATSLLVPYLLPSDQYSIFILCWSGGQLVAGVAYEWMRIGVLRYSVGADLALAALRRQVLLRGFIITTGVLLTLALFSTSMTHYFVEATFVATILVYGAAQGVFEGLQAKARAQEDNHFFAASWVMRASLSFVLAGAAAWTTGKGLAAIIGLTASFPLTMLVMSRLRVVPKFDGGGSYEQFIFLARYGVFSALATIVSLTLPTALRLLSTTAVGLVDAGGLLLAADLTQKAVSIVGLAVNIVVAQSSIRIAEFGSETAIRKQIKFQIGITLAFILPASLGFYLIQGSLMDSIITEDYHQSYSQSVFLFCIANGVLAFRMFGIDTIYIAIGKTQRAIWGPFVSVAVTAFFVTIATLVDAASPMTIALSYLAGVLFGACVSIMMLTGLCKIEWPVRDTLYILIATSAMTVVYLVPPMNNPPIDVTIRVALGGVAYGCIAYVLNIADVKGRLMIVLRKRRQCK